MKNIKKGIDLNIDVVNYAPITTLKQEDNATLELNLYKDGEEFNITGQTVTLAAKRSDKVIIEQIDGFTINNNTLTINLKNNIIAKIGLVYLELTFKDVEGSMTTLDFNLKVNGKLLGEDSLDASDNIASLEKVKQDFINSSNALLEDATENENTRVQAEKIRKNDEETRNRSETSRTNAETKRVEAEKTRVNQESLRVAAEEERVAAERIRDEKVEEISSQCTKIEDKTECIQHINLVSPNNVSSGFLGQDVGVDTINTLKANAEYVTSPIINVVGGERLNVYVEGFSVALFYSYDGTLRSKQELEHATMQKIIVPNIDGYEIVKCRIFNSAINKKFFISKISDVYTDYNTIKIDGLLPNDLSLSKMEEVTNNVITSIGFTEKIEQMEGLEINRGAISRNGNLIDTADANHYTIQAKKGEKYIISGTYAWNYPGFVFKDINNNVTVYPTFSDSMDKYTNEVIIINEDGELYINIVYGNKVTINKKNGILPKRDILFQKTIYFDGDSITFGAGGKSFAKQIGEKHLMQFVNKAVSGTTLAIQDGKTNSILERVKDIDKNYEFIIIEGGYNDWFQRISIGALTANYDDVLDEKTVIGATESICKHIKINFDDSNFLFVLGHRASEVGKIDNTFDDYWNAIESALIKWSVNYVDLRKKGGLVAYNQTWLTKYFGADKSMGTHPNELGYKRFYVPYIESELVKMTSE